MSTFILSLPPPLLLLVHLYILEYPYVNKAEYDENIFNPNSRGLRDRTKTMEDISFFLLGRVEGGRDKSKAILPTYPCTQPSETLAFRTSLSKYLENLRHRAIYPSSAKLLGPNSKTKHHEVEALWWRDVIVRKSLLEECAGEKFERLVLAFSTHALMRASAVVPPGNVEATLKAQPLLYANMLSRYRALRRSWISHISHLLDRRLRCRSMRELSMPTRLSSKLGDLSGARLKQLAGTKIQKLLSEGWSGCEGRRCMAFVTELIGIGTKEGDPSPVRPLIYDENGIDPTAASLPVAAARHPTYLKKFRQPLLSSNNPTLPELAVREPPAAVSDITIKTYLAVEKQMSKVLANLLKTIQTQIQKRRARLDRSTNADDAFLSSVDTLFPRVLDKINPRFLISPLVTLDTLDASDQVKPLLQNDIELRIQSIRQFILPPYPVVPSPAAPRLVPKAPITSGEPSQTCTQTSNLSRLPLSRPVSKLPVNAIRSVRRKSARFSTARKARPSIYVAFEHDIEVDQIIDETEDHSTDEDSSSYSPFKTPRAKNTPNRIWTAGSAKPRSTVKKGTPRVSFPLAAFMQPTVSLPSLLSSTSSSLLNDEDDGDDSWGSSPVGERVSSRRNENMPHRVSLSSNGSGTECEVDGTFDEGSRSMTLREILLSADADGFDLIEDEEEDDMHFADNSFGWA